LTTLVTVLVQVALPIGLLLWLGARPASSALGFAVQATGFGAALLALGLVAIWAGPPFWFPWLYGLAWIVIVGARSAVGRAQFERALPSGWFGWTALLFFGGLAVFGGCLSIVAFKGRRPPAVEIVDIASPFGQGLYLVAHAGSRELVNPHLKTLDMTVERFRRWHGQSYALDIFGIDLFGLRLRGWQPQDPARYETFGAPLVAPCEGRVAVSADGLPDMPVPQMDEAHRAGNYVMIDCGGFAVALAHLRQGSVLVEEGQHVELGEPIGEIGNSGASSEPHLHIHAQRGIPEAHPFGGEPLALRIGGRFLVRNDRLR
jgi:Peptidase family M23